MPSPSCWLYLDCEAMTGQPAEVCPNKTACRRNTKHSPNSRCELPYTYVRYAEELGRDSDDPLQSFGKLQVSPYIHEEAPDAIEHGWQKAERLFYTYDHRRDAIVIGEDHGMRLNIPEQAAQAGFARAKDIPYALNSGYIEELATGRKIFRLIVTGMHPHSSYIDCRGDWAEAGWYPAIDNVWFMSYQPDLPAGECLFVNFDPYAREYEEAIAMGWHRPCYIGDEDDPVEGDDDDDW